MNQRPLKIAISAGELSGDEHAARLVSELRRLYPSAEFRGMGGSILGAQGVDLVVDADKSGNVMGFRQVLLALPRILSALRAMKSFLRDWLPDVLIVVDYPDFHFRILPLARALGIPVLYFIPPSVWAWRAGRLVKLKKFTSALALIYPFEEEFYRAAGVINTYYVGHPFSEEIKLRNTPEKRAELRNKLGLPADRPIAALFPGSRRSEIERNLATICEAFQLVRKRHPELLGVIAAAPSLGKNFIEQHLHNNSEGISVLCADSLEVLAACDGGILKSGTSNLQAAFVGTPFAMIFIDSQLSKLIVKRLVKLDEYSIVNIIKPGTIREFADVAPPAAPIAEELEALLFDLTRRAEIISRFNQIRSALCSHGSHKYFEGAANPYARTARLVESLL